jgi:hypothetical protein
VTTALFVARAASTSSTRPSAASRLGKAEA